MKKYQLFAQKMFESRERFEDRLNEECRKGYRAISMTNDQFTGRPIILLEKTA
jgi:hypothetical protein